MSIRKRICRTVSPAWIAVIGGAVGVFAMTPAWAANVTFSGGNGSSAWDKTNKWLGGALPTSSDVAVFSATNGALTTVTSSVSTYSVAGLRFTNTGSTSISGTVNWTLTLGSSGITVDAGAGNAAIGTQTNNQRIGLVLSGNQTWINSSSGTLTKANAKGAFGTEPTTALNGFTLTYDGPGPIVHDGAIGNSGTSTAGPGALVRNGSGTTTLSGSNSLFAGPVTVNAGTLLIDSGAVNGLGTGVVTMAGGAIGVTPAVTSGTTLANPMNWSGNFAVAGSASQRLTFGGTTTIVGSSRTVTVNSGTLNITGPIVDGGSVLGFTKSGPGLLELRGTNTYTGPTTISSGTVSVRGDQSAAAGLFTVASGAVLMGTGTLGGPVSILSGGLVAPGTSPGTLTVNNSFSLDSTSILQYELNAANNTVGGGINDLITGVTNLSLSGTFNLLGVGDWTTVADNTAWRLFDYSGSLSGPGLTLGSMPTLAAGQSFVLDTSTTGQVNLIVVPEPAMGCVLLAGVGAALGWWRVRGRRST